MRLVRALIGLDALWQFEVVVETAVEVGAVLATAWLVSAALRGRPAVRHAAWSLGLAAALLLPIARVVLPQRPLHYPLPESLVHLDNVPDFGPLRRAAVAFVAPELAPATEGPRDPRAAGPGPMAWALLAWGLGSALAFARLGRAGLRLRAVLRQAAPVRDAEDLAAAERVASRIGVRPARLLESGEIDVPFACGALRPTVVLPRERRWSRETRDLVLAHELAHVRRRDWIHHLIGGVAGAVYWFHPVVRIAARRQRDEAERASDVAVLGTGVEARAYARGLLDVVRGARPPMASAVAVPFADPARLERRLRAILAPPASRPRVLATALLFAALVTAGAGAAMVRPAVAPSDGAASCEKRPPTAPAPSFFVPKCQSISTQEDR